MMRRALLQRLPLLAAALAPLLRPTATRAQGSAHVWLRVRNQSQEAFTHVWQGLPQQRTNVDLGPLLPGDTSRWHALPATLAHYRKTRIQIGQRQLDLGLDHLHQLVLGLELTAGRLGHGRQWQKPASDSIQRLCRKGKRLAR